jgi:hypothetical protein
MKKFGAETCLFVAGKGLTWVMARRPWWQREEKLRFTVEAMGADGRGPKAGLTSVISAVAASSVSRSLVFD